MTQDQKSETDVKSTGHIYDGIEELDHAPPFWFRALFYSTVVFGVAYFLYYTLGPGPTLTQEYRWKKGAEEYAQYERLAKAGGPKLASDQELKAMLQDPVKQKTGGAIFQSKCVSCHGAQGQGGIGPNLTDRYWLHGGKLSEILATITRGVPDRGMPPWGPILSGDEIQALTVFIRKLAGTDPPGAKQAQGTLIQSE